MQVVRIYTGDDNQTHFEDIDLPFAPGGESEATPDRPAAKTRFNRYPADFVLDWHCAPQRQYVVTLSGQAEITIGDGTTASSAPATSSSPRISPARGTSPASSAVSPGRLCGSPSATSGARTAPLGPAPVARPKPANVGRSPNPPRRRHPHTPRRQWIPAFGDLCITEGGKRELGGRSKGTSEEGPHAPGNGPAVFGRKLPAGEAGAESAFGTDPPCGGLGPAEQAGGAGLRRSRRAAQLSPAAAGQGLTAGAMVQPLRPADGGSPGGPYLLPSLRGAGPPGGRAGPLDHQPVPHGVGGTGS